MNGMQGSEFSLPTSTLSHSLSFIFMSYLVLSQKEPPKPAMRFSQLGQCSGMGGGIQQQQLVHALSVSCI